MYFRNHEYRYSHWPISPRTHREQIFPWANLFQKTPNIDFPMGQYIPEITNTYLPIGQPVSETTENRFSIVSETTEKKHFPLTNLFQEPPHIDLALGHPIPYIALYESSLDTIINLVFCKERQWIFLTLHTLQDMNRLWCLSIHYDVERWETQPIKGYIRIYSHHNSSCLLYQTDGGSWGV